jgi:hypothetical protein
MSDAKKLTSIGEQLKSAAECTKNKQVCIHLRFFVDLTLLQTIFLFNI